VFSPYNNISINPRLCTITLASSYEITILLHMHVINVKNCWKIPW